jgi:hypothetical protein
MLSVQRVLVQGEKSTEFNYGVCLDGRAIRGARHSLKSNAQRELEQMQSSLTARQFLAGKSNEFTRRINHAK